MAEKIAGSVLLDIFEFERLKKEERKYKQLLSEHASLKRQLEDHQSEKTQTKSRRPVSPVSLLSTEQEGAGKEAIDRLVSQKSTV